ncbi:MAG: glycosyltransferase [Candidatus Omnitrophica bacterium]|nr:glycosyltransferase [Candidatus Omnitrophota bacterium]
MIANEMISGFDIICISTSDWDKPWGSRQQLMTRFSGQNRILFVGYQASLLHLFKYPGLFFKIFGRRIRKINGNITVYRPLLNLPFRYYSKGINRVNQVLLLLQLRRLAGKLEFSNVILWIFEPTAYMLVGKLRERMSIYHCIDSFKDEKCFPLRQDCIEKMETKLCERCDLIFASSLKLMSEKSDFAEKLHFMPSAVDEEFFNENIYSRPAVLFKTDKIAAPRIGFVGTLDHRIDYDLLDAIARERKEWSIILLGEQVGCRARRLKRKNIYVLGRRDNKLVPSYISLFDVCILPYKVNNFTRGISPSKVFEYLSLGKPVVSTDLPDLGPLADSGLLKIANNGRDFIRYIDSYLGHDSQDVKDSRIRFARLNTWDKRVEHISEILKEKIDA